MFDNKNGYQDLCTNKMFINNYGNQGISYLKIRVNQGAKIIKYNLPNVISWLFQ